MRITAIIILLLFSSFTALDYTAENLLPIIGMSVSSEEFKAVKDFWLLDKNMESNYGGIKFIVNSSTGKVQSVLVAGENFQLKATKFFKCSSPLPFAITINDDVATLKSKLGEPENIAGKNTVKFYRDGFVVEVLFNGSAKVSSIKFYKGIKPAPVVVSKPVVVKTAPAVAAKPTIETKTIASKAVNETKTEPVVSSFKKAVMNVFAAYKESNFNSIKSNSRNARNFWNYEYTYSTNLKIPGEKFNMLYSFPFTTSPLDFVSVIKEADAYDGSFQTTYKQFEKQLLQSFTAGEGWTASCIPNKESKTLSDLEFTNERYGSVILDYCKSPKGKHILYLRFLLYST